MSTPSADSYTCASGSSIAAGRYRIAGNRSILIWGQSNAVGRAAQSDVSASPLSADAELATYMAGTFARVYIWTGSAYAQLTSSNNGCDAGQFGPEFGLAVRWMRETTTGNLYLDKEAAGGVSIGYFAPSGAYYPDMVTRKSSRDAWLTSNSVTISAPSGWLWVQGEADYTESQSWYQTRLDALISGLETDGFISAASKRMLAQMPVGTGGYGAGVALAKTTVAAASPVNTEALPMENYYQGDNIHLNGQGQAQLGYDAFERIYGVSHVST